MTESEMLNIVDAVNRCETYWELYATVLGMSHGDVQAFNEAMRYARKKFLEEK